MIYFIVIKFGEGYIVGVLVTVKVKKVLSSCLLSKTLKI